MNNELFISGALTSIPPPDDFPELLMNRELFTQSAMRIEPSLSIKVQLLTKP
jgi:hypothetical protein